MSNALSEVSQDAKDVMANEGKKLSLDNVLPLPFKGMKGDCSLCGKSFSDHYFMDFFVYPKHVIAVGKYFNRLRVMLDSALNSYNKLSESQRSRFWGDAPIVDQVLSLAKEESYLANYLTHLGLHYDPADKNEFRTRTLSNLLFAIQNFFEAKASGFVDEFWHHKKLSSFALFAYYRFGVTFDDEKEDLSLDKQFVVETAVKENDDVYKKFLAVHEVEAKRLYSTFVTWISKLEGIITGFHNSTLNYLEGNEYRGMIKSIQLRNQKAPSSPKTAKKV